MQKAVREGKELSSWDNPNVPYEEALQRFVHETLKPSATNPFPEQMALWVERIGRLAAINSLAQTLLRLTIPGMPDTYRGSELWDFSLVDPDNRRPVDYALRRQLLELGERVAQATRDPDTRRAALGELAEGWKDAREKLYLVRAVLTYRREHPQLFQKGSYTGLAASGEHADRVCAFVRVAGDESAIVIVPRLLARIWSAEGRPAWGDTTITLPAGNYRSLLSGATVEGGVALPLESLLSELPVALLVSS
jgi:(1->4)-alpha-D-glucan 1-alpha-D-glucosylmutase